MRWRKYQVGEERVVRKFLWWPMCLNGQTRWLERAYVRQIYDVTANGTRFWRWLSFEDGYNSPRAARRHRSDVRPSRSATRHSVETHKSSLDKSHELDPISSVGLVSVVKTSQALHDKEAVDILVAMGSRAVPILLRTAQSDLAGVQPVLAQIGPDLTVPALVKGLESDAAAIRQMAAVLLWFPFLRPKSSEAIPALIDALKDDDPSVRSAVLRTLGELAGSAVSLPQIQAALMDNAPQVRRSAASALGKLGPLASPAVPDLRGLLTDEDVSVRESAAAALKAIESR